MRVIFFAVLVGTLALGARVALAQSGTAPLRSPLTVARGGDDRGRATDSDAADRDTADNDTADDGAVRSTRKKETAVFAGGCFWCTELAFEQLKGVSDVESGYAGGTAATATYGKVHQGRTQHAECVRVTYNPDKISYEQLLDVFFDAHDPTQFNRQGEDDVGRQYRSAIFIANDQQRIAAEEKIKQLERQRIYKRHIVTRLEPLEAFYPAEDDHQNFAWRNPRASYIQMHAIPRACNVRDKHPELIDHTR